MHSQYMISNVPEIQMTQNTGDSIFSIYYVKEGYELNVS